MISFLYTGHLSHSETSTIQSYMLCFVPWQIRKNRTWVPHYNLMQQEGMTTAVFLDELSFFP